MSVTVARRNQPRPLAYAQITAAQTGISTVADITGLTVTFTAGSRPVWVELFVPFVQQKTTASTPGIYITDDSNVGKSLAQATLAINDFGHLGAPKVRLSTLVAGTSYTFKARASVSAGTVDVYGNAAYPAWIRAYEE